MSCSACTIHRDGFSSEAAYLDFEKKLSDVIAKGDLKEAGRVHQSGPFLKLRYVCNRCGSCWMLSVPDQAFRGGWELVPCN